MEIPQSSSDVSRVEEPTTVVLAPVPPQIDVVACRVAANLVSAPYALLQVAAEDEAGGRSGAMPAGMAELVESLGEYVVATRETLVVNELRRHRWRVRPTGIPREGTAAVVGVPIWWEGKVIGSLCVADRRPRSWSDRDVAVLEEYSLLLSSEVAGRSERAERRSLENRLRMLQTAVENMQLGVTVTDADGRIIYTNPAEAAMHGYGVNELLGRPGRMLGSPELRRVRDGSAVGATTSWTRESVNIRKDGSRFPVLLWSDKVVGAQGEYLGMVTCSEDLTEKKVAEQTIREFALRDPLTDLPNRLHFLERLQHAIHRSRHDREFRFAVLFLDLDRFKLVNDSLGHVAGDELLVAVSRRLQSCIHPADSLARFGGDEFAILVEGISGMTDAEQMAERIQAELAVPVTVKGHEVFTSASIGIVLDDAATDHAAHVWRSADVAMYRAKVSGTGRFAVFDEAMHDEAVAKLAFETDLRRAVEREELYLEYQPVVDLKGGGIVGFEALLRWQHPERGVAHPTAMIPVAEETGLIHSIGDWVLSRAADQLGEWRGHFTSLPRLWMGVNLSGKQLANPDLIACVRRSLAGFDEPGALKLEITESSIVENSGAALETLQQLKGLGAQLYLDDFGTGYSSLSYLHRLPVDALKIDRSFVSEVDREAKHAQLVRTIVHFARSAKLAVVGEGVVSPAQLAFLRSLGCDLAQGYYFARPLPADEAEELLKRGPTW
jgi:diguanylate cyclase (GGDEF)-like protein/PAS domain S-box-containing protein